MIEFESMAYYNVKTPFTSPYCERFQSRPPPDSEDQTEILLGDVWRQIALLLTDRRDFLSLRAVNSQLYRNLVVDPDAAQHQKYITRITQLFVSNQGLEGPQIVAVDRNATQRQWERFCCRQQTNFCCTQAEAICCGSSATSGIVAASVCYDAASGPVFWVPTGIALACFGLGFTSCVVRSCAAPP